MKIKFLITCILIFILNFNFFGESAEFKVEVPKKGMKWFELYQNYMYIKVNISQNKKVLKSYENGTNKLIKKEVTIIDSDDKKVNKIRVTYKTTEMSTNDNGQETQTDNLPVLNKTYIIERADNDNKSGEKFIVTNEQGEPPSQEELNYILKEDYTKDNDFDYNVTELNGKKIEVGEKVDCFNYIFDDFMGSLTENSKNDNKDYSVTLKAIRNLNGRNCGIFGINYKITYKDGGTGLEGTLNLKGEIIVATDTSQLINISFKGPLTMNGTVSNDKEKMDIDGAGSINYVYDQPGKL